MLRNCLRSFFFAPIFAVSLLRQRHWCRLSADKQRAIRNSMTHLLEVVSQGEARTVKRKDGSTLPMREIELRTLEEYPDTFVATAFGTLASCGFDKGRMVCAELRFHVREHEGRKYQEVTASAIRLVS